MWSARIALAVVSAVSLLLGVVPAAIAASSQSGLIAFRSDRDGNSEIYTMNPDGSGVRRLTNDPAFELGATWSPDGTKIAFASNRDGGEIYTMNADGSGVTMLTNHPAVDWGPAWSPDGGKITFTSDRDGNSEIYTMNTDGSGVRRLTNNPAADGGAAWSPDGQRLIFSTYRDFTNPWDYYANDYPNIYAMAPDGSDVFRLTDVRGGGAEFSPDGKRIVFQGKPFRQAKIFIMAADGSGPTNIPPDTEATRLTENWSPHFSPDGSRIVFASSRDGRPGGIYTMAAHGQDVIRVTNDPFGGTPEDWHSGPTRTAFKNASQFCKAEQAFWGAQFASRYGGGANAHGKCVSGK